MLNTEYRNMYAEITLTNIKFSKCFDVIKPFRNSVLLVRYSIFLAVLLLSSNVTTAQTLESLYTGLVNATSISVTPNSVYVVEQGKDRMLKLDHAGKLLDTYGGTGSGEYQFSKPVDVDATNGLKIFVSEQNNRRIQVFDRRGQFLSSISEGTSFINSRKYEPDQVSVSKAGEIYFWDTGSRLIRRFDVDYNFQDEFRISSEVRAVGDMQVTESEILILDKKSQTIHRLLPNGGYSGFYPAEGVYAFHVNESGLWRAYVDRVEFEGQNKEESVLTFGRSLEPKGIYVQPDYVFILTENELYKLETE